MEKLKARTHYADWKGTASADEAHPESVHDLLTKMGLIKDDEFLLSVSFFAGEGSFAVCAHIFEASGELADVEKYLADHSGPIPVREVRFEITPAEFLELFKDFNVVLTWDSAKLEAREYSAHRAEVQSTTSLN